MGITAILLNTIILDKIFLLLMPLFHQIKENDFTLALWQLSEPFYELQKQFNKIASLDEIEKANKYKYEGRKAEWMAVRLLIANLFNKYIYISYTESGKPFIKNSPINISISHTKGMVAVIVSKSIVGVDIEKNSDRVLRIENKFMSETEKLQIDKSNKANNLLIYWSAKETLYKIFDTKGLDFKKNLYINNFELMKSGGIVGNINTETANLRYKLNYFHIDSNDDTYIVVYACQ